MTRPYFHFWTITSNYIVEICFGIANGQISSIFDIAICRRHDNVGILLFHVLFVIKIGGVLKVNAKYLLQFMYHTLCGKESLAHICRQRNC